jgi:hypothetical protein
MEDKVTVGDLVMGLYLGVGTNMADDMDVSYDELPKPTGRVHKVENQGFITRKGQFMFAQAVKDLQEAFLTVHESHDGFFKRMPSELRDLINQDEFLNNILSRDRYYEAFAPHSSIFDPEDCSCPLDDSFAYLNRCGFKASIRTEKNGYNYVKISW